MDGIGGVLTVVVGLVSWVAWVVCWSGYCRIIHGVIGVSGVVHCGNGLISAFQKFVAIIKGKIHFRRATGHRAFILWGFKTFLIFPYFLKSS